jgi:dipeptidyl aminopeptidase/acylaminoacyl peptidase
MTLYREPHWSRQSPDRRYFTSWASDFTLRRGKSVSGPKFVLHLGRADGTGSTRILTTVCGEDVAWSPDSKRVAFSVGNVAGQWPWAFTDLLDKTRSTRIFLVNINGTNEEMILEKPGDWHVQDWSPDGKKLLLAKADDAVPSTSTAELVDYDLAALEKDRALLVPGAPWQSGRTVTKYVRPVLGGQPGVMLYTGRYSPDGKSIATIGWKRPDSPGREVKSADHELGVIDRAKRQYREVVKYEEGLRGPICWSPDGREILFSRPLARGDKREHFPPGEEAGLGIWAIRPDGTKARLLTTGWSPDWR